VKEDSSVTTTVGERVKRRRKEKNITQVQLAQQAAVTQSYISKIESGNEDFTLSFLMRIAEILGVSPAFLLDGATAPTDAQMQDGLRVLNHLEALHAAREYADMLDVISAHGHSPYFTSSIHNHTELSIWEIKAHVGLYEFEKAKELCEVILPDSARISDLMRASLIEMYGVSTLYLRQPAKAKDLLKQAHSIVNKEERASHMRLKRSINYYLGLAYSDMGDITTSEQHLGIASQMLDTEIRFHARRNAKIEFVRGANRYLCDDIEQAHEHFMRSYREYMRCEDIEEACRALNNVAYLSKVLDNGLSEKYYRQLQDIAKEYPDKILDIVRLEAEREGYPL
jgi:transcriptional regulator with XRE-family HTH domain